MLSVMSVGSRVSGEGPGFGVRGLGFGVWGLGFGVWGLGLRFGDWGWGFEVRGLGSGVWGSGFGAWGLGFGVKGASTLALANSRPRCVSKLRVTGVTRL